MNLFTFSMFRETVKFYMFMAPDTIRKLLKGGYTPGEVEALAIFRNFFGGKV